jgi:predicted ATPase
MLPLRGRDSELSGLKGLVASAMGGQGGVALVEGPAGIGKTRLLAEAAQLGRENELVVAAGVCDELDQVTPWGPLLRALSSTEPALLSPVS